jgi:hypothetical protein
MASKKHAEESRGSQGPMICPVWSFDLISCHSSPCLPLSEPPQGCQAHSCCRAFGSLFPWGCSWLICFSPSPQSGCSHINFLVKSFLTSRPQDPTSSTHYLLTLSPVVFIPWSHHQLGYVMYSLGYLFLVCLLYQNVRTEREENLLVFFIILSPGPGRMPGTG